VLIDLYLQSRLSPIQDPMEWSSAEAGPARENGPAVVAGPTFIRIGRLAFGRLASRLAKGWQIVGVRGRSRRPWRFVIYASERLRTTQDLRQRFSGPKCKVSKPHGSESRKRRSGMHLAEGVGLEPRSPFGQRFSSPLTASSRNIVNLPGDPLLPGQRKSRNFFALPVESLCF
jgi:hypothetical protein